MVHSKTIITRSAQETMALGEKIAKTLNPGAFIGLKGDLGTGKTVFTKGIAKGLGVREFLYVNSPTFVIIKEYKGKVPLYHFDVYRLNGDELDSVGYEDYFYGKGVTIVEWVEKLGENIPKNIIEVRFAHIDENSRKIEILD